MVAAIHQEFRQNQLVMLRRSQHRDRIMVLRCGADQRRAANIDILDAILKPGAGGHGRLERVQIHRH